MAMYVTVKQVIDIRSIQLPINFLKSEAVYVKVKTFAYKLGSLNYFKIIENRKKIMH